MIECATSTISGDEAARRRWDVVVVGAGPAGASAAIALARDGVNVLLIDKQRFPRTKVCGGCINASALSVLEALGVRSRIDDLGARRIDSMVLAAGGRCARVRLDGGVSLSRAAFDAMLVQAAIDAGARFVDAALARSTSCDGGRRRVQVERDGERFEIEASIVIAADGLAGRLASGGARNAPAANGSLMGAASMIHDRARQVEDGVIFMACGSGGYVGAVRLEDGLVNVAAALKPEFVRACGGPGAAAARLMDEAGGRVIDEVQNAEWKGTPLLTRRTSRVALLRMLVVGDAAGYVEPFTGEGIAWGLASGVAAAQCAVSSFSNSCATLECDWSRTHRQLLSWRQRRCLWLTRALRYPAFVRAGIAALSFAPIVARPFIRGISQSEFRLPSCRSEAA